MKRIFTLMLLVAVAQMAVAQSATRVIRHGQPKKFKTAQKAAIYPKKDIDVCSDVPGVRMPVATRPQATTRAQGREEVVGITYYDLQTNGATYPRLINKGNGNLSAAWTYSGEMSGYTDRGTGYNTRTNGAWGPIPTSRVESVRTGFTNLISNGTVDQVLAHKTATPNNGNLATNNNGTWTETAVTSTVPNGLFWYRAARSGNYVHVIGLTTPTANGGVTVDGIDGQVLYFRSSNGGNTWDKVEVRLPGVDSTTYNRMGADSYAIDARGENVAIVSFNDWNDTFILKSEDNGETWTRKVMIDFPLDNYRIDSLYTVADIPADPGAPDSLAIFSTDGTGEIVIDDEGLAHVVTSPMYYQDDAVDGNWSFYPTTNGLLYWNETFEDNTVSFIDAYVDANGNDTIDIASNDAIASYGGSALTSHSSIAARQGTVFIVYSAIMENFIETNAGTHYRHIFAIKSEDGGETWGNVKDVADPTPYDIINTETIEEADLIPGTEAMFPSVAKNLDGDGCLHILYQKDFAPGVFVQTTQPEASENQITYVCIADSYTSTKNVAADKFKFEVSPNPTAQDMNISFNLPSGAAASLTLNNVLGQTVYSENLGNLSAGQYNEYYQINNLTAGVYFLRLQIGNEVAVQKLIKQ